MKGFILLLICAIVALIIVGGALGYSYIKESDIDSSTIDKVVDKVNEIESSNDNKNNERAYNIKNKKYTILWNI